MPRRKKIKMLAKDTAIYEVIVAELSKNTELAADYNMEAIELTIPKKKAPSRIQDVDKAIDHLKRYLAINGKNIQVVNGEQIITKKDLAKMLGISRPTLDKWIECGFIKRVYSKQFHSEFYQTDKVLEELERYKVGQ